MIKDNIVILGCGLSGMLTALSFASVGIKTTIIEAKSTSNPDFFGDIRTTALTDCSKNFLDNINLWSAIAEIAGGILDIYVVDSGSPSMLHFCLPPLHHDKANTPMGYIVKNSELKQLLLTAIRQHNLITLLEQCDYQKVELINDDCIVHLANNTQIHCDLLILCNGAFSAIRQAYFPNKILKYYGQSAITFNVRCEKAHENVAIEHFRPSGPFAILPLKDPHSLSIVWTFKEAQAEAIKNLPLPELEYFTQQNFGNFLGKISIDSAISIFPLKAYLAKKYFHQQIVLVADTAHIIHPLAGQGLNQGIKDIEALTKLIKARGINQETLRQYQQQRQIDNMLMYLITDNLNRIFSNDSQCLGYLRRAGLKAIEKVAPIKNQLINYAMGKR